VMFTMVCRQLPGRRCFQRHAFQGWALLPLRLLHVANRLAKCF
jgi:hypothetical protein